MAVEREQVLNILRQHETELRQAGIVRLAVFGSVARQESTEASDVDLMARFDPYRHYSLLDLVGIENRLADILGTPVDLAPEKMLKPSVSERAQREAVVVF